MGSLAFIRPTCRLKKIRMPSDHRDTLDYVETASPVEYVAAHCSVDCIRTFAGSSSGIASSIVTCPLDVIRIKLQAQGGFQRDTTSPRPSFANRGLLGVGRQVWLEKGLKGMYQGLGPTVLGYFPRWAIFFATYHRSYEVFDAWLG